MSFGKRLIVDPPDAAARRQVAAPSDMGTPESLSDHRRRENDDDNPIDITGAGTMVKQPNAINWFEIPVDDFARAKMFYSRILAYEMPEMDMGSSRMGMLPFEQGDGRVGGAIVKTEDFLPARQGTLVYLNGGEDLTDALLRVDAAGGKVLTEKTLITPEMGYYAIFLDSEGNKVGLHSPK
ncbi:MAG: VOC family protein [Burkholderiaceae bacterium]